MPSHQVAVAPAPVAVRGPSVFARTPVLLVQWVWRTRWRTAPVTAGAVVFVVGYSAPLGTAAALLLTSAVALAASRRRHEGRQFLSSRERRVAAVWAAAAALWAVSVTAWPLPPRWSAVALACATAWPAVMWATSRRVRRGSRISAEARRLVDTWAVYASAVRTESPHHASTVVPGSVRSTSTGGTVFDVRVSVHAMEATTEAARRGVEFFYRLPIGTVTVTTVNDGSDLIRMAFNPHREMEAAEGIPYEGPRVDEDGRIPIAVTPRGEKVGPRAFDKDGVKHCWVNGGTGSGKSTTTAVLLLPPVLDGHEILIYLDGKGGTSLSAELEPLMTVIAETPEEWRQAIRAFGALIDSRQANRKRITRWRGKDVEPYPAVRLVIEEAPDVAEAVGAAEHAIVARGGRAGRALGLAVTQISQGTNADQLVGGRAWRANASQVLVHRPGDTLDGGKATNSSSDLRVDPMKLPSGPGWVGVLDHGDTWMPARVQYASPEQIGSWTDGFQASPFTGSDFDAVDPHLNPAVPDPDDEPETAEEAETTRSRLLAVVRAHEGIPSLGFLTPSDGSRPHAECDVPGCPAWELGRRQTIKHLNAAVADGQLAKEGTSWLIED